VILTEDFSDRHGFNKADDGNDDESEANRLEESNLSILAFPPFVIFLTFKFGLLILHCILFNAGNAKVF